MNSLVPYIRRVSDNVAYILPISDDGGSSGIIKSAFGGGEIVSKISASC